MKRPFNFMAGFLKQAFLVLGLCTLALSLNTSILADTPEQEAEARAWMTNNMNAEVGGIPTFPYIYQIVSINWLQSAQIEVRAGAAGLCAFSNIGATGPDSVTKNGGDSGNPANLCPSRNTGETVGGFASGSVAQLVVCMPIGPDYRYVSFTSGCGQSGSCSRCVTSPIVTPPIQAEHSPFEFEQPDCEPTPGLTCTDGNACTLNDACTESGTCEGEAILLTGTFCSQQVCDSQTGEISFIPLNENEQCGEVDPSSCRHPVCQSGSCVMSEAEVHPTGLCQPTLECDGAGNWVEVPPPANCCVDDAGCDDGNVCTQDSCDVATGTCENTFVGAGVACDDNNPDTCNDLCQVDNGNAFCSGNLVGPVCDFGGGDNPPPPPPGGGDPGDGPGDPGDGGPGGDGPDTQVNNPPPSLPQEPAQNNPLEISGSGTMISGCSLVSLGSSAAAWGWLGLSGLLGLAVAYRRKK